jgi:hypothetical protein
MQFVPRPPDIETANSLVKTVVSESSGMASSAATGAMAAINALGVFDLTIPEIAAPNLNVPTINLLVPGTAPTDIGSLDVILPPLPTEPVQGSLSAINVGDVPAYTLAAPLLVDVPLPNPMELAQPVAPILTDVAQPGRAELHPASGADVRRPEHPVGPAVRDAGLRRRRAGQPCRA